MASNDDDTARSGSAEAQPSVTAAKFTSGLPGALWSLWGTCPSGVGGLVVRLCRDVVETAMSVLPHRGGAG